jgi:hypothetical protein
LPKKSLKTQRRVLGIPEPSKKVFKIPIKLTSVLTEKREKTTKEIRDLSSTIFE